MSSEDIKELRSDIKELTKAVANLSLEVALLKRDKAWQKWVAGVVGSVLTLVVNTVITKGS
jgi:hypothetical protein